MSDNQNRAHGRIATLVAALGMVVVTAGAALVLSAGAAAAAGDGNEGCPSPVSVADCPAVPAAPVAAEVPVEDGPSVPESQEPVDGALSEAAPVTEEPEVVEPEVADAPEVSPPCLVAPLDDPAATVKAGTAAAPAADVAVDQFPTPEVWLADPPVAQAWLYQAADTEDGDAEAGDDEAALAARTAEPAAQVPAHETVEVAAPTTLSAGVVPADLSAATDTATDAESTQGPALPVIGMVLMAVAGVVRLRRALRGRIAG